MNVFTGLSISAGQRLECKYPKHGRRNILKFHAGVVEIVGFGPNGPYARIRSADKKVRTLRCDRMVDPSCS